MGVCQSVVVPKHSRRSLIVSPKQHEKALFEAARNLLDPAARRSFLDHACVGNSALRARLDGLLSAQPSADKFFDGTAPFRARLTDDTEDTTTGNGTATRAPASSGPAFFEEPGMSIGRYKLLQRIGEGGCGVVYMAEQIQ